MPAAPEFERADDHRLEEPMHTQWTRMMVAPIALAVGLGAVITLAEDVPRPETLT